MQKDKNYIIYPLIMAIICFVFPQITYAESGTDAAEKTAPEGFFYEVKYPENQREDSGYFDLTMQPGQKQTVQIMLRNLSDKEISIDVSLSGAKTNQNGVIEYGPTEIPNDPSLKFDFTKIASTADQLTLAPKEDKALDIELTMPETSFDGIVVGGIQLKETEGKKEDGKATDANGANVVNKYAYVIAMVLRETEIDVQPELAFNKIEAGQSNYRNSVFVNVSNTQANFLRDLSMEVQITKKGSEEVLYETKRSSMRMAPNSFINFPVSMDGARMEAGDYQAKILAKAGDKDWSWTEGFKISNEQADKFNREDLSLIQKTGINWGLILGIAGGVFLLAVAIFFVIHRMRNQNKKNKKKNGKK